jgi:hypothetical protein
MPFMRRETRSPAFIWRTPLLGASWLQGKNMPFVGISAYRLVDLSLEADSTTSLFGMS